jgi:hypothetical protein
MNEPPGGSPHVELRGLGRRAPKATRSPKCSNRMAVHSRAESLYTIPRTNQSFKFFMNVNLRCSIELLSIRIDFTVQDECRINAVGIEVPDRCGFEIRRL